MTTEEKLESLTRHISSVQKNCEHLGMKLIKLGHEDFGRQLIANGWQHDQSKFHGAEWQYLHDDIKESNPEAFKIALYQHNHTNSHHPEFFGSIELMPRIAVAEMCCDWYSRSAQFGQDVRDWIKERATKKFNFHTSSKVYRQIKEFMDLLLDAPFK